MSYFPAHYSKSFNAEDVLNAIRNSASVNYQNAVPYYQQTSGSDGFKAIGQVLMDCPAFLNEFLSTLVNRIAFSVIISRTYENPLAPLKKGIFEYGETIEEIYTALISPHPYDRDAQNVFESFPPEVRTAFHPINYMEVYPVTVNRNMLRKAFLNASEFQTFVDGIISQVYTSINYDEFIVTKYLIARCLLNGRIHPVTVDTLTAQNVNAITTQIKATAKKMSFMSPDYNLAGVRMATRMEDMYLLVNSDYEAYADVNTLAFAFNMSKAELSGHMISVDGFGVLDFDRLDKLFEKDPTWSQEKAAFTPAVLAALNAIPCVALSRDWPMIYDNLFEMTDIQNPRNLSTTFFTHVWRTISFSPFQNAAAFIPGEMSVTAQPIKFNGSSASTTQANPTLISQDAAGRAMVEAAFTASNFAPVSVNWAIEKVSGTETTPATISATGLITWDISADATYKITATSTFDPTKTATAYVSVELA